MKKLFVILSLGASLLLMISVSGCGDSSSDSDGKKSEPAQGSDSKPAEGSGKK